MSTIRINTKRLLGAALVLIICAAGTAPSAEATDLKRKIALTSTGPRTTSSPGSFTPPQAGPQERGLKKPPTVPDDTIDLDEPFLERQSNNKPNDSLGGADTWIGLDLGTPPDRQETDPASDTLDGDPNDSWQQQETQEAIAAAETRDDIPTHENIENDNPPSPPQPLAEPPHTEPGQSAHDGAQSEASSEAMRTRGIPKDLEAERLGVPGRIRTEAELTDEMVARILKAQLQHFTPEQIEELIASFPDDKREAARQILYVLSHSANLENMAGIVSMLNRPEFSGRSLYSPGTGTLVDTLHYLANEKNVIQSVDGRGIPQTVRGHLARGSIVLVDRHILERLRTDAAFVDQIINNGVVLLYVSGYSDGITPFNSPTVSDLRDRVNAVLNQPGESPAPGQSLGVQLALAFREQIKEINPQLADQLHLETLSNSATSPTVKDIVKNLNGDTEVSAETIKQALASLPPEWHPLARELYAQLSDVYSHLSVAHLAREQLARIESYAATHGIAPQNIVFVVSNAHKKSFGIAAYVFSEANADRLHPSQFVSLSDKERLAQLAATGQVLFVALDDNSGSGQSLLSEGYLRGILRKIIGPDPLIVAAPLVASTRAFEELDHVAKNDRRTNIIAGNINPLFEDTDMLRTAGPYHQRALIEMMGYRGFYGVGSALIFPWMGPDTNSAFFGSAYLMPAFILNKKTHAIKTSGPIHLPDSSILHRVIETELAILKAEVAARPSLTPQEAQELMKRLDALAELTNILWMDSLKDMWEIGRMIKDNTAVKADQRNIPKHLLPFFR